MGKGEHEHDASTASKAHDDCAHWLVLFLDGLSAIFLIASLHHAGLIAKALDARNKELRKKMCESEQYRIVGILLSPHHITTPYITTHIFFF